MMTEEERRIANTTGVFRWTKIKGRDYLQMRHRDKLIASYPSECGRGLWLELNRLLKGTAPDLGKDAPAEVWAYSIRKNITLPKDPKKPTPADKQKTAEAKHALILQFIKALRMTARQKGSKLTSQRLEQIGTQLIRLDAVLASFKYSWQEGQVLDRSYAKHYAAPARKERAASRVDAQVAAIERRESAKAEAEALQNKRFGKTQDELEHSQEAAFWSCTHEGIVAVLKENALEATEENFENTRVLVIENLRQGNTTTFGNTKSQEMAAILRHAQHSEIELNGALAILDEAGDFRSISNGVHKARHIYPVDPSSGKLNNENCLVDDQGVIREVPGDTQVAQEAALESLGADREWLTKYHADLLPPATTDAEDNRRKSKASYLKAKVLQTIASLTSQVEVKES
jgi:hypothetical protein